MFDFFDAFFKSEMANNNIIVNIVIAIMLLVFGAVLMWFFMSKVYTNILKKNNSILEIEVVNLNKKIILLENELKELKEDRDNIIAQSDKISYFHELTKVEEFDKKEEIDPAIEQFINNKNI